MSTPALPRAEIARHTVEALYAEHGRARPWIYWTALTLVAAGLASLPLIEVDVSFSAPGMVRPATERVALRVPYGGRVAEMFVRENENVAAGQPLLRLATPDLDERIARNSVLQTEARELIVGLDGLLNRESDGVKWPTDGMEVGPQSPGLLALRQDAIQYRQQIEANRIAEAKAGTELQRAAALAEKGIATLRELDDSRYALERVQAEARVLIEQTRTRWRNRFREEAHTLQSLVSEARRIQAERESAIVRSPVAGTVQGGSNLVTNLTLNAGQVFGEVSPDGRLLAEVLVSTRDIASVKIGQPVRLQIDALPYTQWGMLGGRVATIAADASALNAGNGKPYFKITIMPSASHLTLPNGAAGELGKGMTLSARFMGARRTLLELLYQHANEALNPRE